MDNEQIVQPEAQQAETQPEATGAANKTPSPAKPRVRRVGTITMGFALIVVGFALCATLIVPTADVLLVAKLSPILLVAIGIEIIIASLKNDGTKIKYDFLSFIMCIFLIIGSIGASLLPTVFKYLGPERGMAQASISNDVSSLLLNKQQLYPDIYSITTNVSLSGLREFNGKESAKDLLQGDWVSVYAELNGSYETKEAFAAAILPLYKAMREMSPAYIQLSAQSLRKNHEPYYELDIGSSSYKTLSPEYLAQNVTKYVYNEEHGYYYSEDDLAGYDNAIGKLEEENIMLQEQVDSLLAELEGYERQGETESYSDDSKNDLPELQGMDNDKSAVSSVVNP